MNAESIASLYEDRASDINDAASRIRTSKTRQRLYIIAALRAGHEVTAHYDPEGPAMIGEVEITRDETLDEMEGLSISSREHADGECRVYRLLPDDWINAAAEDLIDLGGAGEAEGWATLLGPEVMDRAIELREAF